MTIFELGSGSGPVHLLRRSIPRAYGSTTKTVTEVEASGSKMDIHPEVFTEK